MKFSTRTDIAAPAEFVFERLADFGSFERAALRRGITLQRLDALTEPGAGMSWDIGFRFRGKQRQLITDIRRFEHPEMIEYAGASKSFEAVLECALTELSKSRTRLMVGLEVKPRSLGARLMVQSAKLGKGNLERRFKERVDLFAEDIERQAEKA
ncbi:MAG: SRPBCC family protein [Thioclava sp.]|nr:SRPBCC family protein [Thioclava sp.]MBD3803653.1 SRPBCC family protein [Thioclava sp.]